MSLPPAEELSRWTVGQVNNWLTQNSLTAFRDGFLRDNIDGSKLMKMQPPDVDAKYSNIPAKKRQALKDHLSKIESPKSPPSWNTAAPPQLPPRPGVRAPPPVPPPQDDGDGSDDGWGSDDFEDDVDEEYLEPTHTPEHIRQAANQGRNLNGHLLEEPQPEYEIPAEDLEELTAGKPGDKGLRRKPSLVDRLKNELEIRKRESQVQQDTPPPRPPRKLAPEGPSYTNTQSEHAAALPPGPQLPGTRHRPPPPAQELLPPDDVYEIMNDQPEEQQSGEAEYLSPETAGVQPNNYLDFSDTCKKSMEKPKPQPAVSRGGKEAALPPRPGKPVPSPPHQEQQGGWLFNNEQATPKAEKDSLSVHAWYHGKISRDHAQRIFEREQKDGMFLIRKSERDPAQPYTLVIWHCSRIWNIPIRKVGNDKFAAGKLKQGETHFSSIPDLVEHFKVVSLNLKSDDQVQGTHNLTVPAPKH